MLEDDWAEKRWFRWNGCFGLYYVISLISTRQGRRNIRTVMSAILHALFGPINFAQLSLLSAMLLFVLEPEFGNTMDNSVWKDFENRTVPRQ